MVYSIIAIIFFFLFTSFLGYFFSIKPPKYLSGLVPKGLGLDYEEVSFTTEDEIELKGWYIPHESDQAKTIILLHGYPADKGNILPYLTFLHDNYNLLLFDFRYHGESEGGHTTIGAEEVKDLSAAINWLKEKGVNEVGVWGFSMGGAVALMSAPEQPAIKVIVSDSSYAQLSQMAPTLFRIPVLKYPLSWLTLLWTKTLLGVDPRDASPKDSATQIDIPLLVIHSKNDRVIPFTHSEQLKESLEHNDKAEFWFHDNLDHGQFDSQYQERVGDFFLKHL